MNALYRSRPGADWQDVTVIGAHASGKVVLREVKSALPGVFLADMAQVRVPVVCVHGAALLEMEAA